MMMDARSMLLIMVMMMVVECGMSKLFRVGNKLGWQPGVNYTEWSMHQQICVGYWLLFNFDKRYYNVLEVNETNYENCNDQDFLHNITRGGRDVYQLTEARPYYFLSSGGYCWNGMKATVSVQEIPPTPAPALPILTAKNGSPSHNPHTSLSSIMLSTALILAVLFKFY